MYRNCSIKRLKELLKQDAYLRTVRRYGENYIARWERNQLAIELVALRLLLKYSRKAPEKVQRVLDLLSKSECKYITLKITKGGLL